MRSLMMLVISGGLAGLAGCGGDGAESAGNGAGATERPGWLLTAEPPQAMGVTEAKAVVQEGDEIVVRARIGGRPEPLSEGSSVFTVMDLSIPHCGQLPEDSCTTPWDYCCETPESIRANAATVQLVGADGAAPAVAAAQALDELDEVVLVGTVGPRPSQDVLTIRATGVYVSD